MCGLELREVRVARVRQLTARLLKIKLSAGSGDDFKEMEAARRTALREITCLEFCTDDPSKVVCG